jgi:hypothetical protein
MNIKWIQFYTLLKKSVENQFIQQAVNPKLCIRSKKVGEVRATHFLT